MLEEYPLYLSYSLDRRIRPRHIYALRSLSTRVATPSPAMLLAPSDAQFALLVGGTLQSYRRWLKEAEADLQRPSNSSRRLQADAAGREDIKMAGTDD